MREALRYRGMNLWLQVLDWKRPGGTFIARGSRINRHFQVGRGTRINGPVTVVGSDACTIGRYCAFAGGIRLITSNHDTNHLSVQNALLRRVLGRVFVEEKRGITIGNDVWMGDSVTVLAGVDIGDGAVVGAGAVVTRSVAPYTVVAGVPARPLRPRFSPEMIALLQEIRWWTWSEEQMRSRQALFALDLSQATPDEVRRLLARE